MILSSRMEELLSALTSGSTTDVVPQSRNEALLLAAINGEVPEGVPQSRMEAYLLALCEMGVGGDATSSGGVNLATVSVYVADYSVEDDVVVTAGAGAVDAYRRYIAS